MADQMHNKLVKELEAAKVLKHTLGTEAEDLELLSDMIEGETELQEIAERVYNSIKEDEEIVVGIKARQDELTRRKNRYEMNIKRRKAMLLQAVSILEQPLTLPPVTLSKRKGSISLVVSDETEVPTQYFKRPAPEIDKQALKAALKELTDKDEPIPGAHLERGPESLNMRVA